MANHLYSLNSQTRRLEILRNDTQKSIGSGEESKLVQDTVYPTMWRVLWPDGELSDMVNKTRAKDAIRAFEDRQARTAARMPPRAPEKPAGAFKW